MSLCAMRCHTHLLARFEVHIRAGLIPHDGHEEGELGELGCLHKMWVRVEGEGEVTWLRVRVWDCLGGQAGGIVAVLQLLARHKHGPIREGSERGNLMVSGVNGGLEMCG